MQPAQFQESAAAPPQNSQRQSISEHFKTVESDRQLLQSFRPTVTQQELPPLPGGNTLEPPPNTLPNLSEGALTPPSQTQLDPLAQPDLPPEPPSNLANPSVQPNAPASDPPSFPPQHGEDESPADLPRPGRDSIQPLDSFQPKSKGDEDTDKQEDSDDEEQLDELDALLEKVKKPNTPDCDNVRNQLRGQPLSTISLDVSPKISDGLRTAKDKSGSSNEQKKRTELAAKSMLRQWTDYRGQLLATGRLVDMRFGNAIIEVDGQRRNLPVGDLSDVDVSYIAEVWNLPFRCGSGYEPLVGRNFIASTVQWKASGGCHNPLYFEQVQLERYGHDAGPVVQPLISAAHFVATIPMLPYKMAINPPHECQYTLGYIRPGNCAPYMVQPFPWSIKAGLVQAGFWTGASALFP